MIRFELPSLGADMDEGTLLKWHVKPGDLVKRGQVIAVVDTSKAAVDVEAWQEGVVAQLLVEPGQKIAVGTAMATLLEPGEAASGQAAPVLRRPISPAARKRAHELGIVADEVRGTGVQGSVTVADIEAAAHAGEAASAAPRPEASPAERNQNMRKAIATAMSRSKREIPHYYLSEPIPMENALAWLQRRNERVALADRMLPAVLLLKAAAVALRRTPELNGFYRDGVFLPGTAVHAGVAISLRGGGLVAPAIHDVGNKSLDALMIELNDLVGRARSGSLRSSEMSDPTITVTNLGDQGVETVFGVIYPPQVALVGFGCVAMRPWAQDGAVRVLPVLRATLAADHRASDGHRGALFLAELRDLLQQPQALASDADGAAQGGTP
ncbi:MULTISPECIES: dihydrolipoamide acetyltransferase family protein [unclassified Variovorax]|uniref:dihydrolipoamide acetyltransferase family protein n=1 Tax=unclassified Variovorax TaxID=663243 RepID=UPI00076DB16E|nr:MULTISPECIES: dihydrolipoamide acetyltransferase family protein [unclassified Variovorax]KWT73296.1 Dihydrolipoamide acetyltransferase component (E2) of acetoin dehydrogenase complex [Variovorax sp. WDL1]PNG47170.1 Dihydrolipoyllysine-residue acetyltransferase component of pyruvate dehydrogenase complex [Variovorax sp. B2]PNG48179.1 Dihydrolipoyllysine-residue acetyltransferase component of pyruvate dehydrogenase complex [Variovorax sp. B4]VTV15047.1 Dihydrolipoyllysine-residue acetyltransfe